MNDVAAPPLPAESGAVLHARIRIQGGRLRAAARAGLACFWSGLLLLVWILGSLPVLVIPRARVRWRHRIVRTWARGLCRLVGMRRTVRGTPPRAPFFLVSNHLGYMDIILLYASIDGVFIAKQEMRHWPVLGPLANLFRTIWVRRTVRRDAVRVLDLIDEAIARGDGVILFAEGTTSRGEGVNPMHPALFDWAAREQYPVLAAAISYRTAPPSPAADVAVCWWGDMPFGSHAFALLRLPRFEASVVFDEAPILAPTRGELAERSQQAIAARFTPVGSTLAAPR